MKHDPSSLVKIPCGMPFVSLLRTITWNVTIKVLGTG